MKKILLVEDDNNLREIYGARLLAEGYDIVSAKDGEEALSMAVAEKPDLIISDIMMPKISGFDMLDILRATPSTKDTKVIMMTALSQAEDRERGERLGADKYLVKSQVTLEDVVKVVEEVLHTSSGGAEATAPAAAPAADPAATPATSAAEPASPAAPAEPVKPADPAPDAAAPAPDPTPAPTTPPEPTGTDHTAVGSNGDLESASRKPKVIAPISNLDKQPDLNSLLAKELAKESGTPPAPAAPAASSDTAVDEHAVQDMLNSSADSVDAEKKAVDEQIQDAVQSAPPAEGTPSPAPTDTPSNS